MVKGIAIYVEGGGDHHSTKTPFREGMSEFLRSIRDRARRRGVFWNVVPCGPRKEAYDKFQKALENKPDWCNVLLVDSEEPVVDGRSAWEHLRHRKGDGRRRPADAGDEQCQMMVVCMEAWLLADPDGLAKHFGGRFDKSKLPPPDQAENRTKDAITVALRQATRDTPAGEYKKIRDGARLLAAVNPGTVRNCCTWCDRFFTMLEYTLGAAS